MSARGLLAMALATAVIASDVGRSKHRGQSQRRKSDLPSKAWAKRKKRNKRARRSRRVNRMRFA